jgi:hypothetical protein
MNGCLNYSLGQPGSVGNSAMADLHPPPIAVRCLVPQKQIDKERRRSTIVSDQVGHQSFQDVRVDRFLADIKLRALWQLLL